MICLWRIVGPDFVCGIVERDGRVFLSAPKVRHLVANLPIEDALIECVNRGYEIQCVGEQTARRL